MKKFVATMVVVVMVMAMGLCAQAELRYECYHAEVHHVGVMHDGKEIVETIYYARAVNENGEALVFEVTGDEFAKLRKEAAKKDAEPDQKNAFVKAIDFITFWN